MNVIVRELSAGGEVERLENVSREDVLTWAAGNLIVYPNVERPTFICKLTNAYLTVCP